MSRIPFESSALPIRNFPAAFTVVLWLALTVSSLAGAEIRFVDASRRSLVPGVRIVLAGRDGNAILETEVAEGRYRVDALPRGSFVLRTEVPGYADLLDATGRGRSLRFAGEPNEVVEIGLVQTAQIAGTVSLPSGKPLAGAMVAAFWAGSDAGDDHRSLVGEPARSDDRGQFRLFGLRPGTYVVAALPHGFGPGGELPLPVYAPGVAVRRDALPLRLRSGETTGGISIQIPELPVAKISGTVAGLPSEGRKGYARVLLLAGEAGSTAVAYADTDESGRFVFPRVAAGRYRIRAWAPSASPDDLGPPPEAESLAAVQAVTVSGMNDPEVPVPLLPVAEVTVRLTKGGPNATGRGCPQMDGIALESLDGWPSLWEQEMLAGKSGVRFRGLPAGNYRVIAGDSALDCYLADFTLAGRSVAPGAAFRIEGPVEATAAFLAARGRVHGQVRDAVGNARSATVVLVSATDTRQIWFAQAGSATGYDITGVPPGEYRLIALPHLDAAIQHDPQLSELPGVVAIALADESEIEHDLEIP